jgi:hypothetical protein
MITKIQGSDHSFGFIDLDLYEFLDDFCYYIYLNHWENDLRSYASMLNLTKGRNEGDARFSIQHDAYEIFIEKIECSQLRFLKWELTKRDLFDLFHYIVTNTDISAHDERIIFFEEFGIKFRGSEVFVA